jgi:hypothetical protein
MVKVVQKRQRAAVGLLVNACFLCGFAHAQTATAVVTLSPSAIPVVAEPGVTIVSIVGSGFPKGTISPSNVKVELQPAVPGGGPAMGAVVSAVTTLYGSTRAVSFRVVPQTPSNNVTTPTSYLISVSGKAQSGQAFASKNSASLLVDPPASIQSISPNAAASSKKILVTIKGSFSHFLPLISRASFGPGISVGGADAGSFGPITVLDATTATAQLIVSSSAAGGSRNVTVRTGPESASRTNGFTVTNGTPVLATVSPNTGAQGVSNLSVALTGQFTHWVQGTTTASFGSGITVNSLTVSSATSATAVVSISATATAGASSVTVTTGTEIVTLASGFTITNGTPVLTTVSPNTGAQGQSNLSVALTGQFTHWVQGTTTASFGSGITVNSLTVSSATTATAVVSISATATAGANTVTVTTGTEVESLTNGFTVTNGTPVLKTVSPNTGAQGQSNLSVVLTGQFTHWVQGTTTASFGSGITLNSLTVSSATSATAVVSISATATAGANSVTVTTGTEVESLANGFTVTTGAANSVTYTYDSQGRLIQAVYKTATGTVTVTYSYDAAGNRTSVVAQ